MKLPVLYLIACTILIEECRGAIKYFNETIDYKVLSREKRFLLFTPSNQLSVMKFVTAFLVPTDIPKWQNINVLRSLQYQYGLPAEWYTNFPVFPNLFKRRSEGGRAFDGRRNEVQIKPDSSRKIAYEILEEMLNRENKNGRECILLTICQVAETPLSHNGLVGELLQVLFTPGEHEIIDDDYRYAMKAGLHHVDCEKLYSQCPFDHRILDSFSIIQDFHFDNIFNF